MANVAQVMIVPGLIHGRLQSIAGGLALGVDAVAIGMTPVAMPVRCRLADGQLRARRCGAGICAADRMSSERLPTERMLGENVPALSSNGQGAEGKQDKQGGQSAQRRAHINGYSGSQAAATGQSPRPLIFSIRYGASQGRVGFFSGITHSPQQGQSSGTKTVSVAE